MKKRPSSNKNLESQPDVKISASKKVKPNPEETVKLNLLIDEDDEEFDEKPRKNVSSETLDSKNYEGSKADSNASVNGEEALTDGNDDECYYCEEGGEILCCDNCFRSFHLECVGLKTEPKGDWICPYCRDLQESKLAECPKCEKDLDEIGKHEKVSCAKCLRNMHLKCTQVPLSLIADNPLNKNFLFEAQSIKGLKKMILKQGKAADEAVKELMDKNKVDTLYHICNLCLKQAGLQKIKMCAKRQDGENIKDYYLAKLKRASDIHTFWLTENQIIATNRVLLRHYKNTFEEDAEIQPEDTTQTEEEGADEAESYQIEKILACRKPLNASKKSYAQVYDEMMNLDSNDHTPFDNYKFFIKWEGLEYSYSSWEDQYIVFNCRDKLIKYFEVRKKKRNLRKITAVDPQIKSVTLTEKPKYIEDNLYPYQLKGLNWLLTEYLQKNNAILSDEMGLGKEIQALCFLRYLSVEFEIEGPFLIVAPTNSINYWLRETLKWCPDLDAIIYGGDSASRRKINDYEFFNLKNKKSNYLKPKFQVAITSFSYINSDLNKLKKVKWEVVIIDDAHKLKSNESRLYRLCGELKPNFKVVLSGAPGESAADDLVNLARYIIPNKPKLANEIEEISSTLVAKPINSASRKMNTTEEDKGNAWKRLMTILEKHTLRRTAVDMSLEFTELEEKLVRVEMTPAQKTLYKNVLLKNNNVLQINEAGLLKTSNSRYRKNVETFKNSLTQILKHLISVCNHPNLYYLRNFNSEAGIKKFDDDVLSVSNKVRLLEHLITKLLGKNQRPIVFTQEALMLDFIEQLMIFKDIEYERIDGATRSIDRKESVNRFLSGKAKTLIISGEVGDLGMDLSSSEAIILVDNQFNIYKDIQPFCKAYPKQNKRKLNVYRLVSQATLEDKIISNAFKKVLKGEVIQNPLDLSKHDKSILETILKYNAKSLINDEAEDHQLKIPDEKIDEIVNIENKAGPAQHVKVYDMNEFYVSGFSLLEYSLHPRDSASLLEEGKESKTKKPIRDSSIIEKAEDRGMEVEKFTGPTAVQPEKIPMETEDHENGTVLRMQVGSRLNSDNDIPTSPKKMNEEMSEGEAERLAAEELELPEILKAYYSQLGSLYEEIKNKNNEELAKVCMLDEFSRLKFLEFTLKYEVIPLPVEELFRRFRTYLEPFYGYFKPFDFLQFKDYLKFFYSALLNANSSAQITPFFFFKVKPTIVRRRALCFLLLRNKLTQYKGRVPQFAIQLAEYDYPAKGKEGQAQAERWSNMDDYYLFRGVSVYGLEEWDRLLMDPDIWGYLDSSKKLSEKEIWKILFKKIEGKEAPLEQEKEAIQFVQDYVKIRSSLLMDMLLDEKTTENTEYNYLKGPSKEQNGVVNKQK